MLLRARGVLYRLSLEEWVRGIGRLGSARHSLDERSLRCTLFLLSSLFRNLGPFLQTHPFVRTSFRLN
jgi:hypothetical protein